MNGFLAVFIAGVVLFCAIGIDHTLEKIVVLLRKIADKDKP